MPRGYSIVLLYPGPMEVAYSSLAFHMLKGILAEMGVGVKPAFLEDGEVRVEGSIDPRSSRAILVSLPYEVMYADLVIALEQLGLSPFASSRGDEDPIVIVGGPAVTANPLPVLDLVDAVLVGEAEPVAWGLVDAL